MQKKSAGILVYRQVYGLLEVLLVHPGGPFWAKKDLGAWSVPKGEFDVGEDPLNAAIREFKEETGLTVTGNFTALTPARQKSGKTIFCWALEEDLPVEQVTSNLFEMEWPPRSGKMQSFPEVDKAAWFNLQEAEQKVLPGQLPLLLELVENLKKQ